MYYSHRTVPCDIRRLAAAMVAGWLLLAVVGGWLGAFNRPQQPPVLLGLAATLPVALFVVADRRWREFRQFELSLDLRRLTLLQTWRVGAIAFTVLYLQGVLPASFAIPAGLGDIAIGATAPLVAWSISARKTFPATMVRWWNVLGVADLLMALTLGVLASGAFTSLPPGSLTTEAMGRLPLSLVPTFLVPFWLILHLISLARVQTDKTQNS
jgi:hypothetical protein